jgi:hypothetical protein
MIKRIISGSTRENKLINQGYKTLREINIISKHKAVTANGPKTATALLTTWAYSPLTANVRPTESGNFIKLFTAMATAPTATGKAKKILRSLYTVSRNFPKPFFSTLFSIDATSGNRNYF